MTKQEQMDVNMPRMRFSAGAISATIWKNENVNKAGEPVEFHTVSLQRAYKDRSDEWKHTSSLRVSDLPKAALVLEKAYEYLVFKNREPVGGLE